MVNQMAFESLVTPAEAVKLARFRSCKDACLALAVTAEYHRTVCAEGNTALLMGVVWNAGRVQGIREERARRKHIGKLFCMGR